MGDRIMPNVATLGLEFTSGSSGSQIDALCKKFDELEKKCGSAQTALNELASSGTSKIVESLGNALSTIKPIDSAAVNSIKDLSSSMKALNGINLTSGTNLEAFFSSFNKVPSSERLVNLGKAINSIKPVKPTVIQSIGNLVTQLDLVKKIPSDSAAKLATMGNALSGFKLISKPVVDNVKRLFDAIATFKPIPADAMNSIRTLTDLFNAMPTAGDKASASSKKLSESVGMVGMQADSTAMAFRALQGALSVQYIERAAAAAVEFGKELAYIKTLAASMNIEQLGAGLMNFSSMLGDPAENANALYKAYSAGIRGTEEEFLKFTEIASKTAQVNRSSLLPMVDAMTAAMNAYGLSIRDTSELADNFFAIVKYGKASGEQLANSFGQVSPTAKTLGVSLDELGASIASLTRVQPTRVAITGLNNMLSKIMKPTKESRLALEKLGVDMSYSAVQTKGFVNVLREVHTALNGNMEALKNIFPDIRGQRAAMHLLGAGWDDFNRQLDNFANKKGSMEEAFAVLENNADVQLSRIPVTLNKITTEAGNMAVSLLTLDGALTPLIASFNSMEEGPRRAFAAIALLTAGYGAYKAALLAVNTYRAIEMRNNQVLGVQTAANVAAVHHSTAAYYRLARAKASSATASAALARTEALEAHQILTKQKAMLTAIESRIIYAKSIGDTTALLSLEIKLKNQLASVRSANIAALTAETKAKQAETAARLLNAKAIQSENMAKAAGAGTGTLSMIKNIAGTGQGFKAGFSAMFDTRRFVASAKLFKRALLRMGSATKLVTMLTNGLKIAWTGLGASLGKVVAVLVSVKAIIAGFVAIAAIGIDWLQSFIRTGHAWGEESKSVTQTLMNGVVDWWTGASKIAKQQDENLAKIYENMESRKALQKMGKNLQERFDHLFDDLKDRGKSTPQKFEDMAKSYNDAREKYQKQYSKGQVEAAFAEADAAQKRRNEIEASFLAGGKKREQLTAEQLSILVSAEEKAKNATKKAEDMNKEATALQDALHNYGVKLYDMASAQKEAIESVKELEAAQNYKMMTPEEQNIENMWQYRENYVKYIENLQKGDAETAKKAFQAMIGNYNSIRDYAMKKIEQNKKTMDNLQKMQMDAMLMTATTDAGKFSIYQKEQQRMQKEANTLLKAGDYTKAAQAWQKSSEAAKKMISIQNKLADAEKKANEGTRKLILQMDKFKSHAVGAVDAFSVQAVELQSRRFDTLPQMKESSTMQESAEKMNQELAKQTLEFIKTMKTKLESDTQTAQEDKEYYDKLWKEITEKNKENLKGIETSMSSILNQLTSGIKVTPTKGFEIQSVRI